MTHSEREKGDDHLKNEEAVVVQIDAVAAQ